MKSRIHQDLTARQRAKILLKDKGREGALETANFFRDAYRNKRKSDSVEYWDAVITNIEQLTND